MKWIPKREKFCARCGVPFLPISSNNRYCRTCAPLSRVENSRTNSRHYRAEHKEALNAKRREYRARLPKAGFKPRECRRCSKSYSPTSGNQKHCQNCKTLVRREWYRSNAALYRIRHPDTAKETKERSMRKRPEMYLAMQPVWSARHSAEVRRKVFSFYSNGTFACACCGESEIDFLTIDHVNNDGARQKRELFEGRDFGGIKFYKWLVKNGYPPGYAVLCMNCNLSKGKHGACMHQTLQFSAVRDSCRH